MNPTNVGEKLKVGVRLHGPEDVLQLLLAVIEVHRDLAAECTVEQRGIELKRLQSSIKVYHQMLESKVAEPKKPLSKGPGIVDQILMKALQPTSRKRGVKGRANQRAEPREKQRVALTKPSHDVNEIAPKP